MSKKTQIIYQVDAFTNTLFSGNPAAICPLDEWLPDDLMQNIAMENNLAETAFYVKRNDLYELRWFTPTLEVDLCGHATLAAAHVLYEIEDYEQDVIHFYSPRSGDLKVTKNGEFLTLNFPSDTIEETELTPEMRAGFNINPVQAYKGSTDLMLLFNSEEEIKRIEPNLAEISKLKARGVIVTAKGKSVDFVSRFFGPQSGINEDPVTGSAHTTLIPFWSEKLNKTVLTAMQLSERGGYLKCAYLEDRVEISGQAILYLKGEILID